MLTGIGVQPAERETIINLAKSSLTQQGENVNTKISVEINFNEKRQFTKFRNKNSFRCGLKGP